MSGITNVPWYAADYMEVFDPGFEIYYKPYGLGVIGWAKTENDARLIAEAGTVAHETGLTPRQLAEHRAELLEALQRMVEEFQGCVSERGQSFAYKQANAAIAKATGTTNKHGES